VLSLDAGNMLTQAEMRLLDEFGLALARLWPYVA
jgi:hypothetical protein